MTTLKLETFGGLSLTSGERPILMSQRRRLALLALLAVAGDRGIQRDKLLGYLWPESTSDDARHSLEQLVYGLRRELGQSVFVGSNPLLLDPQMVTSDVGEFQAAIESGRLADAVPLYRGPFLDGFFITNLSELEEWTSLQRQRLADDYATALEKLAEQARERGDVDGAVDLWRKRASIDALSARGALGLMRALADAGDRAGALQHAQVYERLMSQHLQSAPDRDVKAFADELRNAPPPVANARPPAEIRPLLASEPATPVEHSEKKPRPRESNQRIFRMSIAIAAVALIGILPAFLFRNGDRNGAAAALDNSRVVVLPFRYTGSDSSLAYLGEGVMDLLSARLTGEGGPMAVDTRRAMKVWREKTAAAPTQAGADLAVSVARDLGAGEALTGELVATQGKLAFSASLIDTRTGNPLARTSVTGASDSVLSLVDQLAARLLSLRAGNDERSTAELTSTSLPALRAFLEGRREIRGGHPGAAIKSFARALEFDSTFALAAVDLVHATGRLFQWKTVTTDTVALTRGISFGAGRTTSIDDNALWARALDIAWRERTRLSARDLALLKALRGNYPEPTNARTVLSNWEAAVHASPDRADANFSLGDVLLYQGRAMGLADSRARAAAAFRRALELDPDFLKPIGSLIELSAFQGDTQGVRRFGAIYLSRDSTSTEAAYVKWRVASALGDSKSLTSIRNGLDTLGVAALNPIQWASQVDGVALEDGDRATRAIVATAGEKTERQIAFHRAKYVALNRGRPREAAQIILAKRELEPNSDLQYSFSIRDAIWGDGDLSAARDAVKGYEADLAKFDKSTAAKGETRQSRQWLFSLALWRLTRNDTTGARGSITRLRRSSRRGTHGDPTGAADIQAELLAGLLALDQQRKADVIASLRIIDSAATAGCCSLPHFINLISARLHEGIGDRASALEAVRRGRWLYPPEYLSTYLREEGRLAALTGDVGGAVSAYRHYLRLRSDPEPTLRDQTAKIRAELSRLERTSH